MSNPNKIFSYLWLLKTYDQKLLDCYVIWNREHMYYVNKGAGYENIKDIRQEISLGDCFSHMQSFKYKNLPFFIIEI